MAYNKVVYGGNTLIDLTDLDVTAGDVLSGVTVILADGTKAVGTLSVLQNLKDGSATGSVRGVSARSEDSNYTMGINAFAEGFSTRASGEDAHAEGGGTLASGHSSHAEGWQTIASGIEAHAEGWYTVASGESAHAEGDESIARGDWSHAQNNATIANFNSQTTIGKYNDNQSNNAFEIGNGTSDNARSNALTVDWGGNTEQLGRATTDDMTSQEVDDFVDDLSFDGSSVKEIRSGMTSSISVSASSYVDVSVVFDAEMSGTPVVVCSLYSTSTAPTIGLVTASAINITSMGFTARVFNADTVARTPAVSYIAVYGG